MHDDRLTADESRQLAERGIDVEEARRQLDRFERPPAYVELVRPCTVGDGIEVLEPERHAGLQRLHRAAAMEGRFVKFVPASGAASRMFRDLLYFHKGGGSDESWDQVLAAAESSPEAAALATFVRDRGRFPFVEQLAAVLRASGQDLDLLADAGAFHPVLDALLGPAGLGYESLPKGLLPFHRYPDRSRTAFEEHLVEAADYVRDRNGRCRLHLTVSAEHREAFAALFAELGTEYEDRLGARFDLEFSEQKPSTDTLAVDLENRPLHDEQGRLLFRPAGHGALIENLGELDADIAFVKNIDNVQPDRVKPVVLSWKRILAGLLVELRERTFESLARLTRSRPSGALLDEALAGVGRQLHVDLDGRRNTGSTATRREFLVQRLDRPLRICGVVPNTGEPGGGPFWVRGRDGTVTPQIVESAQVDPRDEQQQRIFAASTHFNPVDLVCALRDARGVPYPLRRYVDEDAVIITRKSAAGRDLKAQERPGLWNGAMAGWNTVFVEVPLTTFSPVKTLLDLLRPEHQEVNSEI